MSALDAATAALVAFDGTQVPSDATVEDEARAIAEAALAAAEPVLRAEYAAVLDRYCQADSGIPEPEDVWRLVRDLRAMEDAQ